MAHNTLYSFAMWLLILVAAAACNGKKSPEARQVLETGCYPHAVLYKGKYYYTMQENGSNKIVIYETTDLTKLSTARRKTVWQPADRRYHSDIWSPELHRINNKWYIYFESDDGTNTDNHQLYVIENSANDPMQGQYTLHGPIITNREWNFGIHPTTIVVKGQQYLLWSGWQHRRAETETQCIYIARMANPWTLSTPRVLISYPKYEWERQWINPDGHRSAYPIYVNENPEAFFSKDGKRIIVCYSASGCWTIYSALGMLWANADADLTNPASWHKSKEPVFMLSQKDSLYGPSDISIVPSQDGKTTHLLYETKHLNPGGVVTKSVRMQNMEWDKNGMPVFGQPVK